MGRLRDPSFPGSGLDVRKEKVGHAHPTNTPHSHNKGKGEFPMEIQKCFYFDFLSAHKVPFLTPILCQVDSLWFNMIDPQKPGFSFDTSRYQTQGYGAATCVFPIVEINKKKSTKD